MSSNSQSASLASQLAALPAETRQQILSDFSPEELEQLKYEWRLWARPKQLPPPGDWTTWLILCGRGAGKTRTTVETLREWIESGACKRVAIAAATAADVRDTLVEGESGILATSPPWSRPIYEPSKRRLTWPQQGAVGILVSADEPDRFRGLQHDGAIADEVAAWRYPDAWAQLKFGLRLGEKPRIVAATTPRPTPLIKSILEDPATVVTRGSSFENRANLAHSYFEQIVAEYDGTRIGRQELYGEILDDNPHALFYQDRIHELRIQDEAVPELRRIVVSIDPAVTSNEKSDETGIVVAGLGVDGHGYILQDASGRFSPNEWGRAAVEAYHHWRADRVIAEVNNGGDLVEANIRTINRAIPFKAVRASRGKLVRAEPVAGLYEQGRVHHVGVHRQLEEQMSGWDPTAAGKSPDRMDALVWALTFLMLGERAPNRSFRNIECF